MSDAMNVKAGPSTLIRYVCTSPAHVADAQGDGYSTLHDEAWAWCPGQATRDHRWSPVGQPMEVDEARLAWRAGRLRAAEQGSQSDSGITA